MTGSSDKVIACLLGAMQAHGKDIPDDAIAELAPEAQVGFATHTNDQVTALAVDVANETKNPVYQKIKEKVKAIGYVENWLSENTAPSTILGENYVRPLIDALHDHRLQGGDYEAFKQDIRPVVDDMYSRIQSTFPNDPGRTMFASKYLDFWRDGGTLYNAIHDNPNLLDYMIRTGAGNLVTFNPFIAGAHLFQMMPKSMGLYGIRPTLKGFADYAANFAKNGLKNIPELAENGVYDSHGKSWDIVTHADNLSKGLSYYVGKAAGEDPMKAIQSLVYRPRVGDECMVSWNPAKSDQQFLMRFALGGMKMYAGWYKNIGLGLARGDLKMAANGAVGLALYSTMSSFMTGTKSAIPAPLWAIMPQDAKDYWQQIDDNTPYLNVLKKSTGGAVDLAQHFQPMGGMAFGAGYEIVNSDIKSGFGNTKKSIEALSEQDYKTAGVDFMKALFGFAQPLVPGANTTLKKGFDTAADYYLGNIQGEEVPQELGQKLHLLPHG